MRFCLSADLVALTSLACWSSEFHRAVLANPQQPTTIDAPTSPAGTQTVYVGPGCERSTNTSYSLHQSQDFIGRGGRTFTVPFNWEQTLGLGFCGSAHYITDVETTNTLTGVRLEEVFTPAQWIFQSPVTANVAIAAFIPSDLYHGNNALIVPPLPIHREATYTVYTRPSTVSNAETTECFSRTIDQGEHQGEFVELGSCRVSEGGTVYVSLSYRDITGQRGGERIVGDIIRFTLDSVRTQP